ncbi:hypothetical protein F5B22DRAFT_47664 [Xylaria bambusicola]|uniref:uncharacterized protein n=1 Tax=Xylaria bambusicola TaxID=326684 RepID=UPI002008B4DF|nr:uncharacterized protein F5B22DRAFT_47664 [Xylaria bambusicola]KAI0520694.1 hypothetical protein F5B22DRAFT_47664 [Xylaria bambusicola]
MPSYPYDRYYYKDGYELAHYIGRDLRRSHRPLRYIVNEGKLIIDERSLEDRHRSSGNRSNTVIYNSPGSTMWIEHRDSESRTVECRGCFRRRERCYGGYCSECVYLRLDAPRRHEVITLDKWRLLDYPERRAIAYR